MNKMLLLFCMLYGRKKALRRLQWYKPLFQQRMYRKMIIRNLVLSDYPAVDMLMSELHELHAEKRPDIYAPAKHIYSEEQFAEMLESENTFAIGAEIEGELAGICFFDIRGKNPKAKGKTGATIFLLKEEKKSKEIEEIGIFEIDGKEFFPDVFYRYDGRRCRCVKKN